MLARFYSTSHLDVARKNLLDHNRFILTKILRSVRASHSHRNNFIPTLFVSFFPSANLSRLRSPDTGIKVKYVSSRSPYHRHDDIVTLNVNVNVKQITRLHDEVSFMLYRYLPPHAQTHTHAFAGNVTKLSAKRTLELAGRAHSTHKRC